MAAVFSRLWTYHYYYDDGVFVFILVALALAALRSARPGPMLWFGLCGLPLWAPEGLVERPPAVHVARFFVWIGAALALAVYGTRWLASGHVAAAHAGTRRNAGPGGAQAGP